MKRIDLFVLAVFLTFPLTGVMAQMQSSDKKEPVTVQHVDLQRYLGTWYEIAKIPNFFQKNCARNTTATYRLEKNGEIEVINRCVGNDGKVNVAKGIAKVVDPESNAKLKVSFVSILGIHLFWGNYWILGLDKNYKYAVVGEPSRKYGWILSRTPALTPSERSAVDEILLKQGYNPSEFVQTEQTADTLQSAGK